MDRQTIGLLLWAGCSTPAPKAGSDSSQPRASSTEDETSSADSSDSVDSADAVSHDSRLLPVRVTLDGVPVENARVSQPGTTTVLWTNAAGEVSFPLDPSVSVLGVMAAHPAARSSGDEIWGEPPWDDGFEISLSSIDPRDNPSYVFQDPGTPERFDNTSYCAHCHSTLVADWVESAHEESARNVHVQDLFAGAAQAFATESACVAAGGRWLWGLEPGTGASKERCYVGDGALPARNPGCGVTEACDAVATDTAECAACHAPGIDGALSHRSLLEATGIAYEHGVHCDVCHKISEVDVLDPDPGVGGRVHLLRPSEESTSPAFGDWSPLTFGPYGDVVNPRMGASWRPLFATADICAGCHEYSPTVPALVGTVDPSRWPDGRLPVQTTYSELRDGPLGLDTPCQSCHMPPDPSVGNSADLGNITAIDEGIAGGWYREPGSVRRHAWFGPRSAEQRMLDLAASLSLASSVADGVLSVSVSTRNVGPGHALPTGEPLRQMVLLVRASCAGVPLSATGGDVVADFGGAWDQKDGSEDLSVWPGAQVGDVLRVVARTGDWYDPPGPGVFGDGTFLAYQKGMPMERYVGEATIVSVDAAGRVETDVPLPSGDRVYRVDAPQAPVVDGAPARAWAGAPGFAFGKVMVDAAGRRNVPHFVAVDVASDNRLPPTAAWTSAHTFAATCETPEVTASLVYRAFPVELARERGWSLSEQVMVEVTR